MTFEDFQRWGICIHWNSPKMRKRASQYMHALIILYFTDLVHISISRGFMADNTVIIFA